MVQVVQRRIWLPNATAARLVTEALASNRGAVSLSILAGTLTRERAKASREVERIGKSVRACDFRDGRLGCDE